MIDSKSSHSAYPALTSDASYAIGPTMRQWVSDTSKYAVNQVSTALRQVPNPAYLLLSAPGQALTFLALAGRGVAGVAAATPPDSARVSAAMPFPTELPDIPVAPIPAWMANLDDQGAILSREARSPRGTSGGRGGGGRSGGSRGGSSRGSSRGGGWGRTGGGGRSGGSRSGGGIKIGGRPAKATGRTFTKSSRFFREYVTSTKTYFVGKKWYNVHGQQVDLYKNLMYTQSGKLKGHITTSRGTQYKINRAAGGWLQIKTNIQLTISTLPKVRQHNIMDTVFKMAVFNLYFNHLWHTDVNVHFLLHDGKPYKLFFLPNPGDNTKIDIGYYDESAGELPTANTVSATAVGAPTSTAVVSAASNGTTTLGISGNSTTAVDDPGKKFIKLASAPKGSSIGFVVLNNDNPKAKTPITLTPSGANTTVVSASNVQATPTTTPAIVSSVSANSSDTSLAVPTQPMSSNITDIHASNNIRDSNNVTRIDTLIDRERVATDALSQLLIMNGDEVLSSIPLPTHKVTKFLINSGNDTILTYSMEGLQTVQNRHVLWWWRYNSIAATTTGSVLLPALTTVVALKNGLS